MIHAILDAVKFFAVAAKTYDALDCRIYLFFLVTKENESIYMIYIHKLSHIFIYIYQTNSTVHENSMQKAYTLDKLFVCVCDTDFGLLSIFMISSVIMQTSRCLARASWVKRVNIIPVRDV